MTDQASKNSLRKALLKKRDSIPPEVRKAKSALIHKQLRDFDEVKQANVIFLFASFRSEVDTTGFIRESLEIGKHVVLPKVAPEQGGLLLYEIRKPEDLAPGCMGIPEPAGDVPELERSIQDVDLIVIPGAGYDLSGNRIGYGAGYYDLLLSRLNRHRPIIAPAYEEQVVASIPAEAHDIPVHLIVTDRRIIRCNKE
jgi:5-formyltetrahydrofolate cyclo-ligase